MIPLVDSIDKQFYKRTLMKGGAPFLTYKDIFPAFQVIKPVDAITTVSIDVCDVSGKVIQTITDDVTLVELSDNEHVVVHPAQEITVPLSGGTLYYGKITIGTIIYYTEVFKTTNNSKLVDVRVTQDDETRITEDDERRIING